MIDVLQSPIAATAAPDVPRRAASPSPAMGATLAGRMAPPLRLPGEHFAAALVFWLLGAAGLVWVAPDVARGAFPLPRVAAVTHLFTLGWITTTIQGALYQFLPVALQNPIRWPRIAHLSFALYTPGLALFLAGLVAGRAGVMLPGAALFGTGLLLFAVNLSATLRKAPERNLTWWALTGAVVALVSTVILGVSLAGNLGYGYLGENRFLAVGVHLHVAVAGWVMLVIVGVAHRLLPMFLLSHGASERPGRTAAGLLAGGVALLLATHHALSRPLVWIIAALLAGGVVAFLAQVALFFRHRKKPTLDPGIRLAMTGMGFLVLALVLAPFFITGGLAAPRVATAYVAALLSALSLFVAGHYYKILPFLIWFHRFGPLVGKKPVPRVIDLYAQRPGNAAVALLGTGALGLVGATLLGAVPLARPAALLFAAGAVIVAVQMLTISRRRPE